MSDRIRDEFERLSGQKPPSLLHEPKRIPWGTVIWALLFLIASSAGAALLAGTHTVPLGSISACRTFHSVPKIEIYRQAGETFWCWGDVSDYPPYYTDQLRPPWE